MTFEQVFTPNLKSPVALDRESDGVFMFGTTRGVYVCRHRRSRERLGRSRAHDGYIARCLGDYL